MNGLYFFDDRVEQADIQSGDAYRQRLQQAQMLIQQNGITPEQMLAYQQQANNAAPGTAFSAAMGGVHPQDYAALGMQDPGQDETSWFDLDDWVSEAVKGATGVLEWGASGLYEQVLKPLVRGAFAVFEGISEEVALRPLSSLAAGLGAADQDVSIREAYNEYGTSPFFQALGNVIGEPTSEEERLAQEQAQPFNFFGKEINNPGFDLGTGFFTGGAAQLQAEEARRLMVAGQKANFGRLYLDQQLQFMGQQPGDRVYDLATGITQFAAEVFLDPSILLTAGTGGVAKIAGRGAGAGARLLGGADDMVRFTDEAGEVIREISRSQHVRERTAEALTIDGLVPRARASREFGQVRPEAENITRALRERLGVENPRDINEVADRLSDAIGAGDEEVMGLLREATGLIEGPNGKSAIFDTLTKFSRNDGLLEVLAEADEVALMNGFKPGRNRSVPSAFIGRLGEASTKEEVAGILTEAISQGHLKTRNFYGGIGNFVRNGLEGSMAQGLVNKVDKFSGLAARGFLDANDPDVALAKLDTLARQAGLGRETRNSIIQRMGRMRKGDQAEMFEIAMDTYGKVARNLEDIDPDIAEGFLKDITNAYGTELENLRKFNIDELGEDAKGLLEWRTVKKYGPDGVEEVPIPQPHLLSEFNGLSVPIPDIDDIRRAATQSDHMRAVYQSAGWKNVNRGLRFLTRGVFKPLVLLRPAYIARTQLDDQMRMHAAGIDSMWSSPLRIIRMAAKAPEELSRLASTDPALANYTSRILSHSIMDAGGNGVKSMRERIWTTIQKPVPKDPENVADEMRDYIRAWRGELAQLSNDQISHYLIANDLDIDSAIAAIGGKRLANPEMVRRMERHYNLLGEVETRLGTRSVREVRETAERAEQTFLNERYEGRVETELRAIRDGRDLDTLVHPATGESLGDEMVTVGDDIPLAPDEFDPTVSGDFPEIDEDEAVTLGEFLDDLREERLAEPAFDSGLREEFRSVRTEYILKEMLADSGFEQDEIASVAKTLRDEIDQWVRSSGSEGNMHTLRESSTLLNLVRQTGPAQRGLWRGDRINVAQFNRMLEEGALEPGQMLRSDRMSSVTSMPDKADDFASFPMTETAPREGNGVQVLYRYGDDVRAQNIEPFNPGEGEWLMPEQNLRIRSVQRVDPDENVIPHGEERYIIDVDPAPTEGVTGQVMKEGPQPWMDELNAGSYDGTAQSLAPKAWDDLDVAERREFEKINEQVRTFLTGSADERAGLMLYSDLRHLVDNAPKVADEIYLPASALEAQTNPTYVMIGGDEATEVALAKPGQHLKSGKRRMEEAKGTMGGRVPERMVRGRIDSRDLDEDVVIRLPRRSQALRVGDDYIVPPSELQVIKSRKVGDQTIIDVEIKHQPGQGTAVWRDADPEASLQRVVRDVANSSNPDVSRLLEDPVFLRGYLESVRDRILTKTNGNERLLRTLKQGDDAPVNIKDDEAFEALLAEHVLDDSPNFLKAQRFPDGDAARDRSMMETIVNQGYDYIVSKPAAYLSRYPTWIEFTTRNFEEMMPSLRSDELRREVLELAETQLGATPEQLDRMRKAAVEASGSSGIVDDLQEARELALAHATESVEELLFDVSNKSAFQDAFDMIFPFVDAWREGLEVWGRLLKDDPSLFLKGLAGMRGAEEVGAIYTNERGERVFSMPGSGTLSNFVMRMNEGQGFQRAAGGALKDTVTGELDEDAIDQVQSQFEFRLSGVNLMLNSVGPGVGPVVQWPAGAFLPDTPHFSGLQEIINPYGDAFDEPGDIVNPFALTEALMPAWSKKVVNAWTSGDIDPIQWNAAVHDSLRAHEMSGRYDPSSMADRERLTEDAERGARWMLMMRGFVHGVSVTGPTGSWRVKTDGVDDDFTPNPDWDPHADPDGVWHEIGSLSSAYWDLYDQYGDSTLAQQEFIKAYGVTPAYLRTPKSRILSNLPATKDAGFWADENRGAMEKYPVVAGYFAPPDEGNENFDYRTYLDQFATGQREMITPEQQIALANRSQAQQEFYNTKDLLEAREELSGTQRDAILDTVKGYLREKYPGWEIPVAGITNIPTDAKIQQLRLAANDPSLADSPLTPMLQQYFMAREVLQQQVREQVGQPNATLARQNAEGARQALMQIGTMLSSQSPHFRGAWELLRREVEA